MTHSISRRRILLGAGTLLAAPALLGTRTAAASTTIRIAHTAPETTGKHLSLVAMAEDVRDRTGGRVAVEPVGKGAFGSDDEMLAKLLSGELDGTLNNQGSGSRYVPQLAAFGLPFLFRDAARGLSLLEGPIGRSLEAPFETAGLVPLAYWDNGLRHVTNTRRAVRTPDDMPGLRLRTPSDPMTMDIFQSMGVATQSIPFNQTYEAIRTGVVDGQENPLANVVSGKLQEVCPFISLTGHKWECAPVFLSVDARRRLGADFELVKDAAHRAGLRQRDLMRTAEEQAAVTCRAVPGLEIAEVDIAAFQERTRPVARLWKSLGYGRFVAELEVAARS